MCGIIGVISRRPTRQAPSHDEIVGLLDRAVAEIGDVPAVTAAIVGVDSLLKGLPGVTALVDRHELVAAITSRLDQLDAYVGDVDRELESGAFEGDELERRNADAIALRDALWSVRNDRLRTARDVAALAGREASVGALAGYLAVQQALSAIDRLEVRGRDSAGIHIFVHDHGLDLDDLAVRAVIDERAQDPTYQSGSVRVADGVLSFVYKAAKEIGELGDNTRALRAGVAGDALLRLAVTSTSARTAVLGHTRWASVGIISEPNAHPVNGDELESSPAISPCPYVVAALNGDVDNHADLRVQHQLRIHHHITTDAKVIPALVGRHAAAGSDLVESFRRTVSAFEGSVAIGAMSSQQPGTMLLALSGSGQGLYVGLADDCFIVASEPYGVVEETASYLRLDGEHGGEIVVLDADRAGDLSGIRRLRYDGSDHPVDSAELAIASVTTRDIDRGDAPHFLLKEISEAPRSFQKTLRGKITDRDGLLRAVVGDRALPPAIAARLADGSITRIKVIGQGTAAVAGQSAAALLDELSDGTLDIDALPATELSGFQLRLDMSDTLAIAVSQSGTTTDTNRTVDLLRARGASVIGIVNRRGERSRRQGRRHPVHVRWPRHRDECRVDEGVLRAGGRRGAAGLCDHRSGRCGLRPPAPRPADVAPRDSRRDVRCAREARRDRRCRAPLGTVEALLGGRGQRTEPRRRRRGADQAQRALLQVDRRRCHGGQEAHRPVVRAVDPRVRGRSTRQHRRRRCEGDGDLPGAQGNGDRRRRRGRGALQRGRHHHGAAGRSGARVRALGDGRALVRLRGGPRDRRVGPPDARGARGDRAHGGRARRRRRRGRRAPHCPRPQRPAVPRRSARPPL